MEDSWKAMIHDTHQYLGLGARTTQEHQQAAQNLENHRGRAIAITLGAVAVPPFVEVVTSGEIEPVAMIVSGLVLLGGITRTALAPMYHKMAAKPLDSGGEYN